MRNHEMRVLHSPLLNKGTTLVLAIAILALIASSVTAATETFTMRVEGMS